MNKTEQIKQIEEAIRTAIPEILELKFGCGVKYGDTFPSYTYYCGELGDGKVILYLYNQRGPIRVTKDQFKTFGEILGREITLQDFLLMIKMKDEKLEQDFIETHQGHPPIKYNNFYQVMMVLAKDWIDGKTTYDLTKTFQENLEKDEFREFVYRLIIEIR